MLLDDVEAVTVVIGVVCVVPVEEGVPEIICVVEVDIVVLDVAVVVNMEDVDEVMEGVSVVLVLMGVIDEALDVVEGIEVETVVVEKIVGDAGLE